MSLLLKLFSGCLSLGLLVSVSACQEPSAVASAVFKDSNSILSPTLSLEIADTDSKRRLGLMYRKSMADNHGMIFIFDNSEIRTFWMKNTYLSLDMIFLDSSFRVVDVLANVPALTTKRRMSKALAKYVVEVNAGLAAKWGVKEGAELTLAKPLK